jgi:hypothetical protein
MSAWFRACARNSSIKGFDDERQAQLIALACTEPPEGYAHWTIRLLAGHAIERKVVETVHFNTVGRALKKTLSSRT